MPLKTVIFNMFSFIWTQPIYKTLRQLKIATIILLAVSIDIMYRLVSFLETANELSSTESISAVGVLIAALFATVWKAVGDLSKPYKSDDS